MKKKVNAEGLTFQEAFEQNKIRGRKRRMQQLKEQRARQIKDTALTMFIALFIIIVTSILIGFMSKPTADAIDNCLEQGYTEYTCLKSLVN